MLTVRLERRVPPSEDMHDQPVNGQEDHHQECACIQQHGDRQRRVGPGEESVQGGAEIAQQTQDMDGTKRLHTDLLSQIERDRHQQHNVETDDAQSHPKRTIRVNERDQDLKNVER